MSICKALFPVFRGSFVARNLKTAAHWLWTDVIYDNRDILIEGNLFEGYGAIGEVGISGKQGTAVLIRNVNGVTIRNNRFGAPATTAPPDARPLVIEMSKNVTLEANEGIEN